MNTDKQFKITITGTDNQTNELTVTHTDETFNFEWNGLKGRFFSMLFISVSIHGSSSGAAYPDFVSFKG